MGLEKRADLVVEKGKERIAIEIETASSDAIENIRKCSDAKFSLVISTPVNTQTKTQLKEWLERS